jgi:hypothetical protein
MPSVTGIRKPAESPQELLKLAGNLGAPLVHGGEVQEGKQELSGMGEVLKIR